MRVSLSMSEIITGGGDSKKPGPVYSPGNLRFPNRTPIPNPKHGPEATSCTTSDFRYVSKRGLPMICKRENSPNINRNTKSITLRLRTNPSITEVPEKSLLVAGSPAECRPYRLDGDLGLAP